MPRKITQEAINAFLSGTHYKNSNTEVMVEGVYIRLYLHGNQIAWKLCNYAKDNAIRISNAGWLSTTTKERLNGIPGVHIVQKKGEWYLNGVKWDGRWIAI